jgi:hypothetical protein
MMIFLIMISACNALSWTTPYSDSYQVLNMTIVNARKGERHALICSTWENEKPNMTDSFNFSDARVFSIETTNSSGNSKELTRMAQVKIPDTNFGSYHANQRRISCSDRNHTLYMEFNVDFEPFIDTRVSHIQSGELIQCPIRAPSRKYDVIWASDHGRVFGYKTKTSFFHHVGSAPCSKYTCNLVLNDKVLLSATINYMTTAGSGEYDITSMCIGSVCSCCLLINFHIAVFFYKKWRSGQIGKKDCIDWLIRTVNKERKIGAGS